MAARKSTSSAFEDMLKDLDEEPTPEATAEGNAETPEDAAPEGIPVPDEPVPVMDTPIPAEEPSEIPAAIHAEMDAGRAALAKYAASSAKE